MEPRNPRLHRIRVEGFRRLQEPVEFDLRSTTGTPLSTVIVGGTNGSGKTSLLEAVLLGLGLGDLVVRDVPAVERANHWRRALPPGARIELDVSVTGGTEIARVVLDHDGWAITNLFAVGAPTDPALFLGRLAVEYFSSWRAPYLPGPVRPMVAGRRPDDTESNRLWRLKQRIIDQRARRGFGNGEETKMDEVWLTRLNAAWRALHAGEATSIEPQIVDPKAEEVDFDLFIVRDGKRLCPIDHASAGELEFIGLAGTLITQDFAGLLVIDEPELHLHREWQAAIVPALRTLAPDAQFLIATHADAPWDQAYSFERFLLVPDTDPRSRAWREQHQEATE